ncbi:dephospho-CoA kinase [Bifidobacterium minimum]|jgi:dephospho-CoA kinase|uniref:Dephospho-CoA kinase n=1 Tax=Bifidobacterium minimum TaxID=1693 RepID=A0A087BQJ7_9BIFI|nr:dephospho-CoA kinase [Bifidobacterium minimum]KFI73297.1 dephospho-CoA kinase [Bifidobacterium minimum]
MRIGLTGGIAAGKTTVARRFGDLGIPVIDYDDLARRAVARGSGVLREIVSVFGPEALGTDGELDRVWMAGHVFGPGSGADARVRLDSIVHPEVFRMALDREASLDDPRLVVHDVPLLAEVIGTIPFRFDHIITVEAPASVRVSRMMTSRGMSEEQARDRIASQPSGRSRRAIADIVIDSTLPLPDMMDLVDSLAAQWAAECPPRHPLRHTVWTGSATDADGNV